MAGLSTNVRGIVLALAGGAMWGFSGACGQLLFSHYHLDPVWVTSMRLGIAGVVMMAIALAMRGKRILAPISTPGSLARIIAFAVFGLAFTQFTYLESINASNAGTATVLEYIGPVLVVLFVCVQKHRLPSIREALAVVCVAAGVFLLATHGNPHQLVLSREGIFWGLLSAVSMMFYTLIPAPILKRHDNVSVLAWATLFGGVLMAVWQRPWMAVPAMPVEGWLAQVVGLTLVGTVIAFLCYFQALKDIGPSRTSMLASTEVASATILAVFWLGSSFTLMDFLGLLFIVATVFLLAKKEERANRPASAKAVAVL